MRKLMIFMFLMLVATASPAYAQTEEKKAQDGASASDSKATVYVYRYKQFAGSALEPSIYCDDKELARMDNGRFFKVRLDPGKHAFRSNDKQAGVQIDLKSGEEYYIRVEIATGFWKGHGRLVLMQKEQGQYEIQKLKPLGADKVKDRERVVIDESVADKKQN